MTTARALSRSPSFASIRLMCVFTVSSVAVKRREVSLGMRRHLGIAAALLGDLPVLMMHEPFNGMDPEGIV